MRFLALLVGLLLVLPQLAFGAAGRPSDCSGTAGAVAANVSFPAAGKTGPPAAAQYVLIVNTAAAGSIWLDATGSTAVLGSPSIPLLGQGNSITIDNPAPASISIIASAPGTAYACWYQ